MKTLDEVIEVLARDEYCCSACPLQEYCCHGVTYIEDALHYLKEYRKLDSLDAVAFPEDADNNAPLTWDELKQMEGKPVWVVPEAEKGYWFVIEFFNNNPYYGGDRVCFTNDVMLNRCDLGKTWQAYQKERS